MNSILLEQFLNFGRIEVEYAKRNGIKPALMPFQISGDSIRMVKTWVK